MNPVSYILGGDTHKSSTTLFHKDISFGPMVSFKISDIFVKHNVKLSTKLFANISSSTFPMTFIKGTFYVFLFHISHFDVQLRKTFFPLVWLSEKFPEMILRSSFFLQLSQISQKKLECVVFILHPFIKYTIGLNSP